MDYLWKLNDPQIVADFQRLCGVVVEHDSANTKNGPASSHLFQNGDAVTPKSEAKIQSKSNGIHASPYNLRSRRTLSNTSSTQEMEIDDDNSANSSSSEDADTPLKKLNPGMKYHVTNRFLYWLFVCGAGVGNELFYCFFFPYWCWNVDGYVCRRVIIVWVFIMYFGQAAKDVIRWPRPSSPPVVRLEKRYELEYGMPSTHAMIGLAFPFTVLIATMNRYEYHVNVGLFFAILWTVIVSLSRLYLGMHSLLDVICGLLSAGVMLPLLFLIMDGLDEFQVTHPYAPYIIVGGYLLMALCYPTLDKWSTARGDTTLILGVGAGVAVGSWLNFHHGFISKTALEPPYYVVIPDAVWFGQMARRTMLGLVILFSTRAIVKAITYHLVCYLLKLDKKDMSTRQRLAVELPYKFIAYFCIAFNVVYLAPWVFRYLGIERINYFTEL